MFDSDTLLHDAVTGAGPGAASGMTSVQDARSVVLAPGLSVYDTGRARAEAASSRVRLWAPCAGVAAWWAFFTSCSSTTR